MLGNAALNLVVALLLRITRCRCRTALRQGDRQRQHHEATGDAHEGPDATGEGLRAAGASPWPGNASSPKVASQHFA
jgi:DNA-directed RNA polymerase specialized sigma24 family protein